MSVAEYLDKTALEEPTALLILDIIHRNFDVGRYSDARLRYNKIISQTPQNASTLRVFRRIMSAGAPLDLKDMAALPIDNDIDRLTAPALHCRRLSLGADYVTRLVDAAAGDEYVLTHAALAWGWLRENRCTLDLPADFETRLIENMARLINADETVSDLEIEAAALLSALGYRNRVPPEFVGQLIAVQQPGGGFASDSTPESAGTRGNPVNWHTSVLALWYMLQHLCGSSDAAQMLAPTGGH